MTEHVSGMELDEIAAGMASAESVEHVKACASCQARLRQIEAAAKVAMASEDFERTFARARKAGAAPRKRWLLWLGTSGALVAACALLLVVNPHALRAKGTPSLELLSAQGTATRAPHIGETVKLVLNLGDHRYAVITVIDASGAATQLWPQPGQTSEEPQGGRLLLPLRVTPGAARIVAALSDTPLSIAAALEGPNVKLLELDVSPVP